MRCVIRRHGETRPWHATVTLNRGQSVVVFRGVPAEVCANCGEYYLSDEVSREVLRRADEAARSGAEASIHSFAA